MSRQLISPLPWALIAGGAAVCLVSLLSLPFYGPWGLAAWADFTAAITGSIAYASGVSMLLWCGRG
jgi:hypothetical protein